MPIILPSALSQRGKGDVGIFQEMAAHWRMEPESARAVHRMARWNQRPLRLSPPFAGPLVACDMAA
jgi:hypothetical protein